MQARTPRQNKGRLVLAGAALLSTLAMAGCRQDMHNQPKFYPQRGSSLYSDGRSVRPQVENSVARGQEDEGSYLMTGFEDGKEGDGMPLPVDAALLQRGQERYNIYCTACHSRVGNGGGIVVQRGYLPAGNFHVDRLRKAPLGHFYNVIKNGYGAMPEYSAMLTVEERWAVVAYIRALQLSQSAPVSDAGGNRIERLGDIAEREGLPRDFAGQWMLPATAVYGTPNNQENGIPGDDGKSNGGGQNRTQGGPTSQNLPAGTNGNAGAPPTPQVEGSSERAPYLTGPR